MSAVEHAPHSVECLNTWGAICLATARHDEARDLFRRALDLDPLALRPRSNLLFLSNLLHDVTREQFFEEHLEWARIHADPIATWTGRDEPLHPPAWESGGKIRIGYVSADLWMGHPIGHIMAGMFDRHDRDRFDVYCYNSTRSTDQLNLRMRTLVNVWRDVRSLGDDELASQIRLDGIDMLIDLSGHTRHNRLRTFARHPAQAQMTWLGYLNTTGMRAMDWRFAARAGESGDSQEFHSEKLWLHDGLPWPWVGLSDSKLDDDVPQTEPAQVVMASFNAFHKLNHQVFDAWGEVLADVPEARLRVFGVPSGRCEDRVYEAFERHGINPGRIEVFGKLGYSRYLLECLRADIALDPFPYNGGATTCECIWMGTPVVSLAGDQGFARTGASILSSIGFPDLACGSVDEYKNLIRKIIKDVRHPYRDRQFVRSRARQGLSRESDRFVPEFERSIVSMLRPDPKGRLG